MHKIVYTHKGVTHSIELRANDSHIALKVLESLGYKIVEVRERIYGYHERIYILEDVENGKAQ